MRHTHLLLFFIVLSISSPLCAFDILRGVPNGLGGSLVLSRNSIFSITQTATGNVKDGEAIAAFAANRKFDLKEFDQYVAGFGVRYANIYSGMLLSSFGQSDLYAEKSGQLLVAYQKDSLIVGGTVSGMILEFGGGFDNLSVYSFGLTAGWRSRYVLLSIAADNLNEPKPSDNSAAYPRRSSVYGEFRSTDRFSLTGRVSIERDETEFGFGQRLQLSQYGELLLGVSTEPFQYGGGVNLFWKQFTLVYAVSYHPDLGLSHTVSLLTLFRVK
jgi:hypothetical protein